MKALLRTLLVTIILATAIATQAQFDYITNSDGTSITITGYSGSDVVIIPSSINGLAVKDIGDSVFSVSDVISVTILDGVTNIGEETFDSCLNLTNIAIPGSVISIGQGDFQGCDSLANATIGFGVSTIETNAFAGCDSLISLTIPSSVTNIQEAAFGQCSRLAQVYFTGNAPAIASTVFLNYHLVGENETYFDVSTAYYLPGTTGWAEFTSNTFISAAPPKYPTNIFVPAILWNPVIQSSGANFGVQSNQFGFDITGTTNIPIVVQVSTNLAQPVWVPLQSMTLTNGLVHFSAPFQSNSPGRFYRIGAP